MKKCALCMAEAVGTMTKVGISIVACVVHLVAGMASGWNVDEAGLQAIKKDAGRKQ